jgi:hypothetical protein
MEIAVGLILIGAGIGALFAGGVITLRRQPERYTYKTAIDPETGEEYDYVIDNQEVK